MIKKKSSNKAPSPRYNNFITYCTVRTKHLHIYHSIYLSVLLSKLWFNKIFAHHVKFIPNYGLKVTLVTTLHAMDCKSIAWFLHCSRHKSTTKKWLTPFAGNLSIRQTSLFTDKTTKFGLVNHKCTCFPLVNIGSIVLLLYVCVRFSAKPNVILQNRVQTPD